jgi:hypothetical protein
MMKRILHLVACCLALAYSARPGLSENLPACNQVNIFLGQDSQVYVATNEPALEDSTSYYDVVSKIVHHPDLPIIDASDILAKIAFGIFPNDRYHISNDVIEDVGLVFRYNNTKYVVFDFDLGELRTVEFRSKIRPENDKTAVYALGTVGGFGLEGPFAAAGLDVWIAGKPTHRFYALNLIDGTVDLLREGEKGDFLIDENGKLKMRSFSIAPGIRSVEYWLDHEWQIFPIMDEQIFYGMRILNIHGLWTEDTRTVVKKDLGYFPEKDARRYKLEAVFDYQRREVLYDEYRTESPLVVMVHPETGQIQWTNADPAKMKLSDDESEQIELHNTMFGGDIVGLARMDHNEQYHLYYVLFEDDDQGVFLVDYGTSSARRMCR